MGAELELYAQQHSSFGDPLLDESLRTAYVRLLQPRMVCGTTQTELLSILIKLGSTKRVLELGAYNGYSTITMAITLEPVSDEIDSIEYNAEMIHFLSPFVARSGCAEHIRIHHGQALELMPALLARHDYDLVYIDANKRRYPDCYQLLRKHLRPEAIILADNTLWGGKITAPTTHHDLQSEGIQHFDALVAQNSRVEQLLLPLRDGLTIIRILFAWSS